MIAGETEVLVGDYLEDEVYDEFLFGSKEKRAKRRAARRARRAKRRSDPKRIARKARRKQFFSRLGQAYRDLGGGAAIGGALDTVIRNPSIDPTMGGTGIQETDTPSDFRMNIGDGTNRTPSPNNNNTLWIVGGMVVVGGIIALAVYQSRKKNYIRVTQE